MQEPLIVIVLGGGLAVVAASIRRLRAARLRDSVGGGL